MPQTTAGIAAQELRKLADALDRSPELPIDRPMVLFYCWTKEEFLGIDVDASIPQAKVCRMVQPAKPAVYECEPLSRGRSGGGPMTVTYPIEVTQRHIDSGIPGHCRRCPIANAINEQVPGIHFVDVSEGIVTYELWFHQDRQPLMARLPEAARDFVCDFDCGRPVSPISFALELEVA